MVVWLGRGNFYYFKSFCFYKGKKMEYFFVFVFKGGKKVYVF